MKRMSLKFKLTLLYTFFMLLMTGAVFAVLFSLSTREILASTQSQLEHRVQESIEDIRVRLQETYICPCTMRICIFCTEDCPMDSIYSRRSRTER